VILTENQTPFVSRIYLGDSTFPITVRSTATMRTGPPACILGLNPSAASTVQFWGNSSATLNDCVVQSNSTHSMGFQLGGSADLTVPCVYSSGGSSTDSGLMLTECASVVEEQPPALDPYADVPPPPIPGCGNMPNGNSLLPGCYNGMDSTTGRRRWRRGTTSSTAARSRSTPTPS
jgi:hypothetical protein